MTERFWLAWFVGLGLTGELLWQRFGRSNPKQKTDARAAVEQPRDRKLFPGVRVAGWFSQQRSDRQSGAPVAGGVVRNQHSKFIQHVRCRPSKSEGDYLVGFARLTK